MATPDLVFYTAKICPYAQRVELAFQEAGANVTRYQIDLQNKPEWYASRVNPASKVPAIAYGNTGSDPENPSSESAKIAESLVLLEFVAELYPDSGLLPKDLVERARVRFFIDAVSNKLFAPFRTFFLRGEEPENFIAALADVQELLSPSGFAVGTGPQVYKEIFESERFERLQKYFAKITSRPSFKNSFDPVRAASSRVVDGICSE
ncbi:hypothetical protein B0F90DRAFT_1811390 [Multifurca ochricompacta]|uniref:GST N-terminal domain-containing protein n=1 Tax=Multifurca ochricompacta TaxID=376703 RepID=A0AAD4QL78_9AGAM|nr:hypothetical protein B0F90DRAFT_1811390 [Multifurca ochricompacta]